MQRLYPLLNWFWGFLIAGILVNLTSSVLWELKGGSEISFATHVRLWLFIHFPWILGAVLFLGVMHYWARQDWIEHSVRGQFALYKSPEELRPEDLGFRVLRVGDQPDLHHRPFYPTYLPRKAIAHDAVDTADPLAFETEETLANALQEGGRCLLIGQPLDGKTRTLYEILKRVGVSLIIQPLADRPVPSEESFQVLRNKRVVLLLGTFSDYVGGVVDLQRLCHLLDRHASVWGLVATCRDGPELNVIRGLLGTGIYRLYEEIPLKLRLLPPTSDEKEQLARSVGRSWRPEDGELCPTLGTITMAEPLRAMRARFAALSREQATILHALQLLSLAGVIPFFHRRLLAAVRHVFGSPHIQVDQCLEELADGAFIRRPGSQDPIEPESAYLRDVVSYPKGRDPLLDLESLVSALVTIDDADALLHMSITYQLMEDPPRSLACVENVLQIRPDDPHAWFGKGLALTQLGHAVEAGAALDEALRLDPDSAVLWSGRGVLLGQFESRLADAMAAFDRALELEPALAQAWSSRGLIRANWGFHHLAVQDFTRALELAPGHTDSRFQRGVSLSRLQRYQGALEDFTKVLDLRPDDPFALHERAMALMGLDRYFDANTDLERALGSQRAIELESRRADVCYRKGLCLMQLADLEGAAEALREAIDGNPGNCDAWFGMGWASFNLGRFGEALQAFDEGLKLRPDASRGWCTRGIILSSIGRVAEALQSFERALELDPDSPDACYFAAKALLPQGHRDQAARLLARAFGVAHRLPEVDRIVIAADLLTLGENPETCE